MANLADDDLLLVQRTSAGISTNYSITGSALKEDLTGVTGLIANPVEVLTPLDGSGLSGDVSYYPKTSAVTVVGALSAGGSVVSPDASSTWISVAYGGGKFVAVANGGGSNRAMYSDDGINWSVSSVNSSSWMSVTYGGDKFVAVGTNSIMYSADGVTWSNAAAVSGNWYSVTYGDGKFVAVSEYSSSAGQQVMYSSNGTSWTTANGIPTNQWCSVTYGNGKFVAVSNTQSNRVMYSTDAINWTSVQSADDNQRWWSITYADGKFVSVERDSNGKAMYSTDGINWSLASVPASSWRSITYGDGKFVAISGSGTSNDIMYSTDGINWTSTGQAQSQGWQSVTYGGDKFVAVTGWGTYQIMYSYDGITWEGDFTKLTLTNDKVFNSSDDTEMNTIDQVLTEGTIVDGPAGPDELAFSTTLYSGNSVMHRPITTGIDNTADSLIWVKNRTQAGYVHVLSGQHLLNGGFTNASGSAITNLWTNSNAGGDTTTNYITGVLDNGFTIGNSGHVNDPGNNYVAWNFREAPGFFDIQTYIGISEGAANQGQAISHDLGSEPGMVIIKNLDGTDSWMVYHKDLEDRTWIRLNEDWAKSGPLDGIFPSTHSSTEFNIGPDTSINRLNDNYVAYLFADTPGKIKCGTYTGTGGSHSVDAGFTGGCAWVMVKNTSNSGDWSISDSTRYYGNDHLYPNHHGQEDSSPQFHVNDNGFGLSGGNVDWNASGDKYIYVAIASNAMAPGAAPTGTLTADADASTPSITLTDVMGTWSNGMTAVGRTQLTEYAPGPDDITFTSTNAGTTPFNGTDATLAFRRWTLESRASAGDPWTVVDTYEDYDITASQNGATPWSSNKPTLSPNTMYRVKVAYISTNADPVESVYNTFTTGSN